VDLEYVGVVVTAVMVQIQITLAAIDHVPITPALPSLDQELKNAMVKVRHVETHHHQLPVQEMSVRALGQVLHRVESVVVDGVMEEHVVLVASPAILLQREISVIAKHLLSPVLKIQ
jgi:hypothetical protein